MDTLMPDTSSRWVTIGFQIVSFPLFEGERCVATAEAHESVVGSVVGELGGGGGKRSRHLRGIHPCPALGSQCDYMLGWSV